MAEKSEPESKEEKKFKIRPRVLDDENKGSKEEKEDDSEVSEGPKHKIRVGKTPFPAKPTEGVKEEAEKVENEESARMEAEKKAEADEEGVGPRRMEEMEAQAKVRKERKRKKEALAEEWGKRGLGFLKGLPAREVRLLPSAIIAVAAVVFFSWTSRRGGLEEGRKAGLSEAHEAMTKVKVELPPEAAKELNSALIALRQGDAEGALKTFQKLEGRRNEYAAMSYLVALAAMQSGDITLAEKKVLESISKGERVSDALALQSVLETQKSTDRTKAFMGDPRVRSEALLRQAIVADAANPYPYFELATLLRYKGEREEAIEAIEAARARLNPMDSHLVMDVTMNLTRQEMQPDTGAVVSLESDDVRKLLPSAYTAMTRGQFALASAILDKCRKLLAPDVFDYLINDPAFRRFAREKELKKFYGY